jgi:hypothetical protein
VKRFLPLMFSALFAFASAATVAQESAADANMQILRDKVKADKKLVVAANMDLTDAEAKAFWPIYEEYQNELRTLDQRLTRVIEAYAEGYNNNSLTDDAASRLIKDVLAIDRDDLAMRTKYAEKVARVLPGKKAMRYLQIESKIRAVIRYQLAGGIPLVAS